MYKLPKPKSMTIDDLRNNINKVYKNNYIETYHNILIDREIRKNTLKQINSNIPLPPSIFDGLEEDKDDPIYTGFMNDTYSIAYLDDEILDFIIKILSPDVGFELKLIKSNMKEFPNNSFYGLVKYKQHNKITNITDYNSNNKPTLGFFNIDNYSFFGLLMIDSYTQHPISTYIVIYSDGTDLYGYAPEDGNIYNKETFTIWNKTDLNKYLKSLGYEYHTNLQNNPEYWNWVLNIYNFKFDASKILNDIKSNLLN